MTEPHIITIDGESGTLSEWARRLGITRQAMQKRLRRFVAPRAEQRCQECDGLGHNVRTCPHARGSEGGVHLTVGGACDGLRRVACGSTTPKPKIESPGAR